ncbi:hypothetical protein LE197_11720 [Pseudomonas sp. PS1(2021)]|nr:hypothetical protein LE197_11720 [Pseudomonas sp. PS1(2021)]
MTIAADDARQLLEKGLLLGFQREASAGSTRYITRFQGITPGLERTDQLPRLRRQQTRNSLNRRTPTWHRRNV